MSLEIPCQGQNNGIVLIEGRSIHTFKRVDPGYFLDKSMKISPELHRAVPWLKREPVYVSFNDTSQGNTLVYLHRGKHEPKVRNEELFTKEIFNPHDL